MDIMKPKNRVLSEAAELFDLPADVVADLPHVELVGGSQFYMEHHRGILSYSAQAIDINGGKLVVRVRGTGLELVSMTGEALRIRGKISQVEWVE